MLTKQQKYLQRQWIKGTLDLAKTARRMGYRGAALTKGVKHVSEILLEMGIKVSQPVA